MRPKVLADLYRAKKKFLNFVERTEIFCTESWWCPKFWVKEAEEMEMRVKDSGPGLLLLLPSGHDCHCSLRWSLSSSSPCLQQQPLHQTLTSRTAATASSACKIINWAISPTLIILGCCLLRLVLKPIQDIIYTISCKVRHAHFFYHFCQRCTNKPSAGKGIIVFMQTVIMLVTPATLLSLLSVTH